MTLQPCKLSDQARQRGPGTGKLNCIVLCDDDDDNDDNSDNSKDDHKEDIHVKNKEDHNKENHS